MPTQLTRRERIGSGKTRARVAVIRTRPETVLDDTARMMRGLDYTKTLAKGRRTILKDNISWHLPYLSANTTPWQLEGVVRTLREDGYDRLLPRSLLVAGPRQAAHGRDRRLPMGPALPEVRIAV